MNAPQTNAPAEIDWLDTLYTSSIDLTDGCGATVSVRGFGGVNLGMGGDLSISIKFDADAAKSLAAALLQAADIETQRLAQGGAR